MRASDAELAQIRRWLGRVWYALGVDHVTRTRAAIKAREWRDRWRGRPPRPVTNWSRARFCAKAGHPLTPENTRVAPNGQRSCRTCLNTRIREWRRARRATRPRPRGDQVPRDARPAPAARRGSSSSD